MDKAKWDGCKVVAKQVDAGEFVSCLENDAGWHVHAVQDRRFFTSPTACFQREAHQTTPLLLSAHLPPPQPTTLRTILSTAVAKSPRFWRFQ